MQSNDVGDVFYNDCDVLYNDYLVMTRSLMTVFFFRRGKVDPKENASQFQFSEKESARPLRTAIDRGHRSRH